MRLIHQQRRTIARWVMDVWVRRSLLPPAKPLLGNWVVNWIDDKEIMVVGTRLESFGGEARLRFEVDHPRYKAFVFYRANPFVFEEEE